MNYRHAYHAGNFADVLKHVVLTRILEYLKAKDKPFRVIDTHAGPGLYDLASAEAQKTGEWRDGVGRVLDAAFPDEVTALLRPWLDVVRAFNSGGGIRHYPGSPVLVRALLRPRDRLTAIELHPEDAFSLRTRFAGDWQARIIELDGWLALGAHVPPKEKRGLVVVDPPFEQRQEFERLLEGLKTAHRRWPSGIYALWYPIKHREGVERFRASLSRCGIPDMIDIAVMVSGAHGQDGFDGSGLIVVNPPYTLENQMGLILPQLTSLLRRDDGARWDVRRLSDERLSP